jgi:hypothetical protein
MIKTRHGKMSEKIKKELSNSEPRLDEILKIVDDYEKDNLDTISKFKRERVIESRRISGALKTAINAHGPITMVLIGSATKRIIGSLLTNEKHKKESFINRILNKLWKR